MAAFNEQLTVAGEAMLAEMLSNGTSIKFTKMVMGDGIASNTQIPNLTDVVNPVVNLDIYSVVQNANNNIIITSIFDNSMITSGFYYREKGIYATNDGVNEILFMYANNGSLAEWIEPSSSSSIIEKRLSSQLVFSQADNVNIELQTGVYATEETCQKILEEMQNITIDTTDIAKEETSEKIITDVKDVSDRIGLEGNDATAPTIFGRLKKVLAQLDVINLKIGDDLSTLFTKINTLLTNLSSANSKIGETSDDLTKETLFGRFAKVFEQFRAADDKIGTTTDTGGTVSAGTVMAKENAILANTNAIKTNTATNNAASDTGTLSQKLSYIISALLGSTADTGGTDVAGTVMAKLNAIINKSNGDISGKKIMFEAVTATGPQTVQTLLKSYTNAKGGIVKLSTSSRYIVYYSLKVDGETIFTEVHKDYLFGAMSTSGNSTGADGSPFEIPFSNSFELRCSYKKSNEQNYADVNYDAYLTYYLNR